MRELIVSVNTDSDDSCGLCHLTKSCNWIRKVYDGDLLVGYSRGPECLASEMAATALRGV
jgi:hypothetical protein